MADENYDRVIRNANFRQLVQERTRFGWILSGLMVVVYLGFILLVAFDKPLMAMKVGTTTSLGIVLGLGVIVFAFLLTGIYVFRANGRFDQLTTALNRDLAREVTR